MKREVLFIRVAPDVKAKVERVAGDVALTTNAALALVLETLTEAQLRALVTEGKLVRRR